MLVKLTYSWVRHMVSVQFRAINEEAVAEGGKPATAEPLLLGITRGELEHRELYLCSLFPRDY